MGQVFGGEVLATAILDRLLHHCDVIAINGPGDVVACAVGRPLWLVEPAMRTTTATVIAGRGDQVVWHPRRQLARSELEGPPITRSSLWLSSGRLT
jgi:hypothetical protein